MERALPRSAYVDPEVWEAERERLFAHQWVCVAHEEDVPEPGDVCAVDVAGESVLVVRDGDALRGFYNVCRHRGSQLVDPGCSTHVAGGLRCPYHAWTYGLDGGLRRAPFVDDLDTASFGLHPVGLATWGGWVFVHLTPTEAPPLADQLGPIPERLRRYPLADLRRGARLEYDVAANWKVIAENFNECYHCGPVHPELCELVPAFRSGRDLDWEDGVPAPRGRVDVHGVGDLGATAVPRPDRGGAHPPQGRAHLPQRAAVAVGRPCRRPRAAAARPPIAHGSIAEFLFAADETADPSDVVTFWDRINRQDWRACERVQRGMSSRAYTHGWFAPMEDESADIRRWYGPLMGEDV